MNYYSMTQAKKEFASGIFLGAQIVKAQDGWMVKLLSKDDSGWLVVLGQQIKKLHVLDAGIAAAREVGFTARQLKIMQ